MRHLSHLFVHFLSAGRRDTTAAESLSSSSSTSTCLSMSSPSEAMGLPKQMSEQTIATIKATAPAVAPKALEITQTFYKNMFGKNPHLFMFFNKANMETNIQPQALADAVVAYATHIDALNEMVGFQGSPVDVMAHKHCALDVQPEHYSVVHKELMGAVGEVLGDIVTPEIAAAWSEAVLFLAKVLIDTEVELYKEAEERVGGWRGFRPMEVASVTDITDDVKCFRFVPPKDAPAVPSFEWTLGQFLSIRIDPNNDGLTAPRHYTLTSPPGAAYLEVTIKKVEGGVVSSYMHEQVKAGDVLQVAPPFGCFTPHKDSSNKVVLVSNGIGVTPMVNFAAEFKSQDKLALVVHADKSAATHPYGDKFGDYPTLFKYSSEGGRTPVDVLVKEIKEKIGDAEHDYYVCGSPGFMSRVEKELKAAGVKNVFSEAFKGHSD